MVDKFQCMGLVPGKDEKVKAQGKQSTAVGFNLGKKFIHMTQTQQIVNDSSDDEQVLLKRQRTFPSPILEVRTRNALHLPDAVHFERGKVDPGCRNSHCIYHSRF